MIRDITRFLYIMYHSTYAVENDVCITFSINTFELSILYRNLQRTFVKETPGYCPYKLPIYSTGCIMKIMDNLGLLPTTHLSIRHLTPITDLSFVQSRCLRYRPLKMITLLGVRFYIGIP